MTLQELQTIVQKHMLIADTKIIKLIAAFVVASRLPINPPWLLIVSNASGGKSTLLSAIEGCRGIFKVDNLTPKTFFSGMKQREGEEDPSLIKRLLPKSVLMIKDFSTLISKNKDDLAEIMAQLRLIYDGNYTAAYGNGAKVNWKGQVSILGAGTDSVYQFLPQMSSMGDRFLLYHFEQPDRIEQGRMAAVNLDEKPAQTEMKQAFTDFIEGIKIPTEIHNADEATRNQIVDIAEMATRARSAVHRNQYRRGMIDHTGYLEGTPRFTKQLLSIAIGLMVINGKWELYQEDKDLLFAIALDTIPKLRREALQILTKFASAETRAVGKKLNWPTGLAAEKLEELEINGIVKRTEQSNKRNKWEIVPKYRSLISLYEHIDLTTDILIDEDVLSDEEANIPDNVPDYMIAK